MWFQQDGVTCHTTRANMVILQKTIPGRVISRRGDINWPPRSCDLTLLDVFFFFFVRLRESPCLCEWAFNSWALKNQHSSSYGWDTEPYLSKSGRKWPQKNRCLQQFAWRSFKWCSISYIISTFRLYNKKEISWKKIFYMYLIYIYFWDRKMDNPVVCSVLNIAGIKPFQARSLFFQNNTLTEWGLLYWLQWKLTFLADTPSFEWAWHQW